MKFPGRNWPWWVVATALLAGLALFALQRAREVEVVSVTRGALVQSIVATGRVDTPARVAISSQAAARIDAVLVREGEAVRAGQPLVRLRSDEARAALEAARAALREAEGRQRQLERVQRPVAEQQFAQARANLEATQRELGRALDLVARGYVSQSRADEAQRQLDTARAALASAQAQAEGTREAGIEAELARARIAQARANLASAEARLDTLVLVAPAPGEVLTRAAEPGDTAQAGRVLLTIARAGATRIVASVDEKNLRWLAAGQRASALADAFPGQPFDARLSWIAPSVDLQRGTVEVWLEVTGPPTFLKPDMTVSVEMVVARRDSVLTLPAWAIRNAEASARPGAHPGTHPDTHAGTYVLLMRDGRALRQPVKPGLRGVGIVEIVEGLVEGDVVIAPESGATPGERVRLPGPRAQLSLGEAPGTR